MLESDEAWPSQFPRVQSDLLLVACFLWPTVQSSDIFNLQSYRGKEPNPHILEATRSEWLAFLINFVSVD